VIYVESPRLQAVFIDRDGTIGGTDEVVYPNEFKLFPNVKESILKLKRLGILVFSFTNQPGISKAEVQYEEYEKELTDFGFDGIYLCPHLHSEGCECRKPSSKMLNKAAAEHNLNLSNCFVIGDRWTDLIAAEEVNCGKVIVKTGSGLKDINKYLNNEFFGKWEEVHPDYIAEDFNDAVDWILNLDSNLDWGG
jgi:histidinol-phosphate phosphatase family protein